MKISSNTNNLFFIIIGAAIISATLLLTNSTNNHSLNKIFDDFGNYFSSSFSNNNEEPPSEEEIPEVDLNQFVPNGWNVMDIVMTNGVVYITANVNNFYGGGCQYDTKIINTNNYDVHIKNSKVSFYNSATNELIMSHTLPFDKVLSPGGVITSFTSTGKNVGKTPHYLEFIPWVN